MTFNHTANGGVSLWRGHPDDNAAHAWILNWLANELVGTVFRQSGSPPISNAVRGNLGESITYKLARSSTFPPPVRAFAANALRPIRDTSAIGLDIAYVAFSERPEDDILAIQEVKTTSGYHLEYADQLISDVEKLSSSNVDLNLSARVNMIANLLDFDHNAPDLAARALALGASTPQAARQVRLIPSLVHDTNCVDPIPKLNAVTTAITAFGWSRDAISVWSIALDELDARLQRLAEGSS